MKIKDLLRTLGWRVAKEKGYGKNRLSDDYDVKNRIARTVFRNREQEVVAYFMGSKSRLGALDNAVCIFKSKQKYYAFSATRYGSHDNFDFKIRVGNETLCDAMKLIKSNSNQCYNNKWKCERNMARGNIKKELNKQISIEAI